MFQTNKFYCHPSLPTPSTYRILKKTIIYQNYRIGMYFNNLTIITTPLTLSLKKIISNYFSLQKRPHIILFIFFQIQMDMFKSK